MSSVERDILDRFQQSVGSDHELARHIMDMSQFQDEEGRFDEADKNLLSTIAANVGAAIHNARLYQETQRRAEEMAVLAEVGNDIAATLDLPTVLDRIASHARDLLARLHALPTDRAGYGLIHADLTQWNFVVHKGRLHKLPDGFLMSAKFPRSIVHAGEGPRPAPERVLRPEAVGDEVELILEFEAIRK